MPKPNTLLIELYGIETRHERNLKEQSSLLIELYGIETHRMRPYPYHRLSFNRTIWN